MDLERGTLGPLPYAATGTGPPVLVVAGLSPTTGVRSDTVVRGALGPVLGLADHRRLVVVNRRPGYPTGVTMARIAAEHAEAIHALGAPVDVFGVSTGGSIAQQLAADHPDVVRRLALGSTACRLGPVGKQVQADVGRLVRAGRIRRAAAVAGRDLGPRGSGWLVAALAWAAGPKIIAPAEVADLAATIEAEDDFDLARCAGPVRAPTLIVAGGRDRFYNRALFEETAALIPDSRLSLYPDRGHIGVLADKDAVAAVAAFLTDQDHR